MTKIRVLPGVWWVEIPETDLRILCGTPMDTIKHLMKLSLVAPKKGGGATYESGPNAILLSDLPVQAGRFWNLAEFPFLHMLYRQGMIIPGHPGNTGRKPLLMGASERCKGVLSYIYRGTYGLVSREEMTSCGVPKADLDDLWKLKLKFAGGQVREPDDLVDLVTVDDAPADLPGGGTLRRRDTNIFVFRYGSEEVEVDLNVPEGEDWKPSYQLPARSIPEARFSVTHIGEGNGWDEGRPCMGSMVNWNGRHYLIDAGPGIDFTLRALGLEIEDVRAVIFTHVHDDHFAGLTTLTEGHSRVRVHATPPVMATLRLKAAALMEVEPEDIDDILDVHYLREDRWNRIDGMEVRPTTSPHPLETTIVTFRAGRGAERKTYAHLADIISMSVLQQFEGEDGISRKFYDRVHREYLTPADLKKIDAGRGLIHGSAEDFAGDESGAIILSHTEEAPRQADLAYGRAVDFGDTDILIP